MYSHVTAVKSLFDQLNQVTPSESSWLLALHQRALDKKPGWKAEANSYIHGLAAAGTISADVADACRDRLANCRGSGFGWRDYLPPIGWIAIASVAMTAPAISTDTVLLFVLCALTAATSGIWASTQPWLSPGNNPRQGPWDRRVVILLCLVLTPLLALRFSLEIDKVAQFVSIERFNAQRAAFKADPQGFPLLQKLAREQYGVEVVLGDAYFDKTTTAISLPNASVGYMKLGPGYCHINLHRANVLRSYGSIGQVDKDLLVQGTMMHEFAHCLDIARDMPAFGQKTIGTRSLAPVDARHVEDLNRHLEVSARLSTQLWREAVADIFAVGYWKLTAPEASGDLVATLRRKRASDEDAAHATMCWIDHAHQASAPSSITALFEWADRLRTSALCELPAPG